MRTSNNVVINGRLMNGYDYTKQAWVKDGKYIRCGHPADIECNCYGKAHEGEETVFEERACYKCESMPCDCKEDKE